MAMHWLDYIILTIIGLSLLTGLLRGFVKELVALGIWILAFWLAYQYSANLEPWLEPYLQDKTLRAGIAFSGILLVTLIGGALLNAMLSFILRRSGLSGTDRLLGMGFGFLRGVFIVALIMLIVQMTSLPAQEYRDQTKLYAKFDPIVSWMSGFMPEFIQHLNTFEHKQHATDSVVPQKDQHTLARLEEQVDEIEDF